MNNIFYLNIIVKTQPCLDVVRTAYTTKNCK